MSHSVSKVVSDPRAAASNGDNDCVAPETSVQSIGDVAALIIARRPGRRSFGVLTSAISSQRGEMPGCVAAGQPTIGPLIAAPERPPAAIQSVTNHAQMVACSSWVASRSGPVDRVDDAVTGVRGAAVGAVGQLRRWTRLTTPATSRKRSSAEAMLKRPDAPTVAKSTSRCPWLGHLRRAQRFALGHSGGDIATQPSRPASGMSLDGAAGGGWPAPRFDRLHQ